MTALEIREALEKRYPDVTDVEFSIKNSGFARCPRRRQHIFCNLPLSTGKRLQEIKSTAVYPTGAMLFIEGQQPRGVFVLCIGRVKALNLLPRRQDHHHKHLRTR